MKQIETQKKVNLLGMWHLPNMHEALGLASQRRRRGSRKRRKRTNNLPISHKNWRDGSAAKDAYWGSVPSTHVDG